MLSRFASRLSALTLLVLVASFALACSSSETVPDDPVTEAELEQEERSVVLYQYRFNPNSMTVRPGTTVTFENRDPEPHNINIPALDIDENVEPNEEWSNTFEMVGDFAVGNRFSDGMQLDLYVDDE